MSLFYRSCSIGNADGHETPTENSRHIEFDVGDQVMVKLVLQQFKSLGKVHKGLIRRYEGLFPVI